MTQLYVFQTFIFHLIQNFHYKENIFYHANLFWWRKHILDKENDEEYYLMTIKILGKFMISLPVTARVHLSWLKVLLACLFMNDDTKTF